MNYVITHHDTIGTNVFTRLDSLNNPVFFEHSWSEADKLNPTGVMTWMVATLTYLDETYVTPTPVVSSIPDLEAIVINPVDVSVAVDAMHYPLWTIRWYNVDEKLTYNGIHYLVVQAHQSQEGWLPNELPALYTPTSLPNVIPDWVQPTGDQDDYNTGDHVMFEGHEYVSLIDANVWSPTAYPAGWQLVA